MLSARECLCEIRNPCKIEVIKTGADARLEYGEVVEVSVPGLEEEVFQGLGMVSSRGLSRGWRGGGSRRVGCYGSINGRKDLLYNRLYNVVDLHARS